MQVLPKLEQVRALSDAVSVRRWSYRASGEHAARAASHPTVEVSWIDHGAITLGIGRQTHEVPSGAAMLVPSGVEHITRFLGPMTGGSIHLRNTIFAALELRAPALRVALAPGLARTDRAFRIAHLLAEEAAHGDAAAILATDALAEAMVLALMRDAPDDNRGCTHDPRIRRAIELVRTSSAEPLSIAELARAAGMSRFHFSRTFRAATGVSPYQYVLDTRLTSAAAMLKRGRTPVTEAALASGFADVPRFARAFRKKYGVVPSVYASGRQPVSAPPR